MPSPDDIRSAIDRYIKTFNAGDRDDWVANFAPDAAQEDPVGSPTSVGHAAIGGFYDNLVASFGVPTITLDKAPIICGNEAALSLRAEAGPEDGRLELDIVDHVIFGEDGMITSLRAF